MRDYTHWLLPKPLGKTNGTRVSIRLGSLHRDRFCSNLVLDGFGRPQIYVAVPLVGDPESEAKTNLELVTGRPQRKLEVMIPTFG